MLSAAAAAHSARRRARRVVLALLCVAASACDSPPAELPKPPRIHNGLVTARKDLDRNRIDRETRYVLNGPSQRLDLTVPPDADLELAVGVKGIGPSWKTWAEGIERMEYSVAYEHDGQRQVLAQQKVMRPPNGGNVWQELTFDLRPFAGQHGTLVLDAAAFKPTDSAPVNEMRIVTWTNPHLRRSIPGNWTNLILISIDTLRADRLGCYGYDRDTSPNVDRLAREGVLFRDMVASSCWTLPSHASMLSGLYPSRHSAVRFGLAPIPESVNLLSEYLWDLGYETTGFVGGGFVGNAVGFGQGFDRFWENPQTKADEGDTLQVPLDLAKPWMEARRNTPFFVFLHTFQVHVPYSPPPPYDTMFDPDYTGPYKTAFTRNDASALVREDHFDPAVVKHLGALYDGEIRAMDTAIGELRSFLESSGLAKNTCVIFTSDHGEEFNEHGSLQHWKAKLYEELVRVPLIVWCPSRLRGGRVVSGIVSHPDILPTALALVGGTPPTGLDGSSLLASLQSGAAPTRSVVISEVDGSLEKTKGVVRAVRTDRYKLIESEIDGSSMLFDLSSDRAEKQNLLEQKPDLVKELRAARDRQLQAPAVAAAPVVTPDEGVRERLRALGYID
jgi:arylsulfatase A-like enzyme